ncbi:nuclear transport factor 2 family protein [Lentzea flaviverrucosa]|uniref:Ketosteroid isomerase-related protein n=1 Tax=Lentzea flaviverrucosa TaxID=200379 RepID=A0A1H9GMF7_9PSEU|nr:nuclear transport factor 2 family protein [Lentzea flaviverrucosa]RDI34864.1 ketosteroid isomerase-like protein [Lentzea flaviverrucosa]SEQ51128.1 Ketosteroid isomerase-related protein [Lentzea flaviverrucosa]
MTGDGRRTPPSAATLAAGVDHVRLSYLYLDEGDLDAYASLLHEDMQVRTPDAPACHGRAAALHLARTTTGTHELFKVIGDGHCVVAVGHYSPPGTGQRLEPREFDFADFFTLSDDSLLLSRRRFYYLPPPA